jgi:hypothetical protein
MFMRQLPRTISATLFLGSLAFASAAMAAPGEHQTMNGASNAMAAAPAATPPPDSRLNDRDADDNTSSNGRYATDRDKGMDRAQDRASAEGLEHGKAFQGDRDADDRKDADDQRARNDAGNHRNDHDADDRRASKDADDRKSDPDAR